VLGLSFSSVWFGFVILASRNESTPFTGTVCYASKEWACDWGVHKANGGLGRSFVMQAVELANANISVLLLDVGVKHSRRLFETRKDWFDKRNKQRSAMCQNLEEAMRHTDLSFLEIGTYAPNDLAERNLGKIMAHALLRWLRAHPGMCSVLHVPDWEGLAAYVGQGKHSGFPELQDTWINVQSHGSSMTIDREIAAGQDINEVIKYSQERLSIEMADSVFFLTEGHQKAQASDYRWPEFKTVMPNPRMSAGMQCSRSLPRFIRIARIIFYGKFDFRKGLHLFVEALLQIPLSAIHGNVQDIVLVGPVAKDLVGNMARLLRTRTKVPVIIRDGMNSEEVQAFFCDPIPSLVVIPSLIEFQSFALMDVLAAGVPFIASDIWSFRNDIPRSMHASTLFDPSPEGLASRLTHILDFGYTREFDTAFALDSPRSANLLARWHSQVLPKWKAIQAKKVARTNIVNVTVAVVVCDRLAYLHEAFLSISMQNYPVQNRCGLIVAACPTSITCSQIQVALALRPKISNLSSKCIELKDWHGDLGHARNVAAEAADTDLIVFVDDDDELVPDALRLFANAARNNPDKAIFGGFLKSYAWKNGRRSDTQLWSPLGPALEMLPLLNEFGNSAVMLRKSSTLWQTGVRYSTMRYAGCEDWAMSAVATARREYFLIPDQVLWYRNPSAANSNMRAWNQQGGTRGRCIHRVMRILAQAIGKPSLAPAFYMMSAQAGGR